jgi:hypothetical protein
MIDDFNTTVGTTGTGMTMANLWAAVGNLEANDAPRPYSCVIHPLMLWGDFGMANEIGNVTNNESAGGLHGNSKGDEMVKAGFLQTVGGVNLYTSSAVNESGSGAGKSAVGACYAKTAISVGYIDFGGGNFIQIESARNAVYAATELVANGYWAFSESIDLHGVSISAETT